MKKDFNKEFNILISKNVAFNEKHQKQFYNLFENNTAFGFFVETFIKEKTYFLDNIQLTLNTNKLFECLKYINKPHPFYCFRYKKINQNRIQKIFVAYSLYMREK